MVILDIGAGAGDSTARLLARYPDARVLCYEPSQRGFAALTVRFEDHPRVTAYRVAVLPNSKKDFRKLFCGADFCTSSFTQSDATLDTYEVVNTILAKDLPLHDMIHIDTNGDEEAIRAEAPPTRKQP